MATKTSSSQTRQLSWCSCACLRVMCVWCVVCGVCDVCDVSVVCVTMRAVCVRVQMRSCPHPVRQMMMPVSSWPGSAQSRMLSHTLTAKAASEAEMKEFSVSSGSLCARVRSEA